MEPTRNLESPELSDQFSYFGFHVFPLFLDITEILCSFDESVHVPEALISEKAAGLLGQLEKAWAGGPGKPGSGKAVKATKAPPKEGSKGKRKSKRKESYAIYIYKVKL